MGQTGRKRFDVTMEAYDGAEICELFGILIAIAIAINREKKYGSENIGLYRDDGLSIFRNACGPNWKKSKSTYRKYSIKKMLNVIIRCNMKIVNYLDVTFNLNGGTSKPCKKPNNETKCIH